MGIDFLRTSRRREHAIGVACALGLIVAGCAQSHVQQAPIGETSSEFTQVASESKDASAVSQLTTQSASSQPAGRPVGSQPTSSASSRPAGQPFRLSSTSQPVYDTTLPKPVDARDRLEREVKNREGGLRVIDRLMDGRAPLPPFDRAPLPQIPRDQRISERVKLLDDRNPFPDQPPLPEKEVTIQVGIGRSTFRTREREEVLSAVQPFIDLEQREVNIRGDARLYETADGMFFAMLDSEIQMGVINAFEYMLIRDWFAEKQSNGTVLLATAKPARPRTTPLDAGFSGTPGTCIELIVSVDSEFQKPADLKDKRLALAANIIPGPGTFLTCVLGDLGHPLDQAFFSKVTLRRYAKDAIIDVLKGVADVACVDQGTVGSVCRFYGITHRIRTVAISPRYNMDVLFTSLNNLETRQEEIELTQRQLTTLGKDPEGQEVLFFFDTDSWTNYRDGDIDTPRAHFADYLKFIDNPPLDLKPLLDPKAPIDRRTYDRFGDE